MIKSIGKFINPQKRQNLRSLIVNFFHPVFRFTLSQLADLYGTDKNYKHHYTVHYDIFFSKIRKDKVSLLEIGIGGYDNPSLGGASLRMWKKYFQKGKIYGIDIHDKSKVNEKRLATFQCNQTDENMLKNIISKIGEINIIIDDGSHKNEDVIKSFNILFPLLAKDGFYVIEDVHTSYRNGYGGDAEDIENKNTTMNYFKKITDYTNQKYFDKSLLRGRNKNVRGVTSIYFSPGLIIIKK